MFDISWLHLIILILASFRLTHLIVFDEIASFIREPFLSVTFEEDDSGQVRRQIDIKGSGWRYRIGFLLSCHWCIGIWSSLFIVALYWFLPASFTFILILGVAGAAAILESKL
ncbi:DUF1360 domain-containing protein [Paenactinomyces guangxiensis]|uniref:DUF1360 domain-containing protein n=1 Tax=Paenactinomyces guangxiensis TaxID=1490290 RepID=A0A7W2A8N0_9BACL|nr:DUF1360 domain-containing protein [Paenactinomyces guangxiensis]MBA4494342.1 DUF1360 domain-containing protein [Paenactinomyces guangxiensis]MBH8590837.1 DUF1360 domain-containing protein [Paenactinomyces guangxiensis]